MASSSGAVLAGGDSRRLGRDKRAVRIDGVPLLRRAALAVARACDEVLVVTRPSRPLDARLLDGVPHRVVLDRRAHAGPLAGVEAALTAARYEVVVVVAGDLPFLAAGVLRLLAQRLEVSGADAAVLESERGPEPLVAAYRRGTQATATSALDGGERSLTALLAALSWVAVPAAEWTAQDPSGRTPLNVNDEHDVAVASGRVP